MMKKRLASALILSALLACTSCEDGSNSVTGPNVSENGEEGGTGDEKEGGKDPVTVVKLAGRWYLAGSKAGESSSTFSSAGESNTIWEIDETTFSVYTREGEPVKEEITSNIIDSVEAYLLLKENSSVDSCDVIISGDSLSVSYFSDNETVKSLTFIKERETTLPKEWAPLIDFNSTVKDSLVNDEIKTVRAVLTAGKNYRFITVDNYKPVSLTLSDMSGEVIEKSSVDSGWNEITYSPTEDMEVILEVTLKEPRTLSVTYSVVFMGDEFKEPSYSFRSYIGMWYRSSYSSYTTDPNLGPTSGSYSSPEKSSSIVDIRDEYAVKWWKKSGGGVDSTLFFHDNSSTTFKGEFYKPGARISVSGSKFTIDYDNHQSKFTQYIKTTYRKTDPVIPTEVWQ